jgi:putative membrane protein
MIPKYADHAANERTFLAWIRTGIAVIVFGFVVEKFNLFMLVLASGVSPEAAQRLSIDQSARLFGRYDGLALIVLGVALIVIAAVRFFRTAKLIDDPEPRLAPSRRLELVFSLILALLTAALCIYLVLT